ncbi:MAG: FAD-dependent monooxygenase [Myxococcota bacterium]
MDAQTIIVGAGPAGALLAFLLSSRGVDTLLLERQSDFGRARARRFMSVFLNGVTEVKLRV